MITIDQYRSLLEEEVCSAIDQNIGRNPLDVALDKSVPEAKIVASQVKYLNKAKAKLPTYFRSRAIIPDLAFEQSSSEACAECKDISGERLLDLTCGLGVDALHLSKRFKHVVALERDEMLAMVARENFRRIGITNIDVINSSAEEFLSTTDLHFDWIYVDPDRRNSEGKKLVRLEDCSPNIIELMLLIKAKGDKLCIKNSPLFDVDEAFRLFGNCRVEVLSVGGECKEVVIYDDGSKPSLSAIALGKGELTVDVENLMSDLCVESFIPSNYNYLVVPDVALKKARLVAHHLRNRADLFSNNGYGFATERPEGIIGEVFAISEIAQYNPRKLKKELKGSRITVMKHEFPHSSAQIMKQLNVKEGDDMKIAFTKIGDDFWSIKLKNS